LHVTAFFLDPHSFADHALGRGQRLNADQAALLQGADRTDAFLDDLAAAGVRLYVIRCLDDLQARLVAPRALVA
jgi:hypothetical protein